MLFPRRHSVKLFLSLSAILFAQLPSCKNGGVEPPQPKNPREYTFTIDTLAYPGSIQTLMSGIWASSPKDVYVVGHNERAFGKMWHFDGERWQPVDLAFGIVTLDAVGGFSANNIFAVGRKLFQNPNPPPNFFDSSLVIWYDGTRWQELQFERQRSLTSIWGRNKNDIWLGGINGTLFHYDGSTMKEDSVPLVIPKDADPFYSFYSIAGRQDSELYMLLYAPYPQTGGDRYYILARQAGTWITIDTVFSSYRRRLWMSASGSLYAVGHGVYQRVGNSWKNLQAVELTYYGVAGTADDNFFVTGSSFQEGIFYGVVYHYNGVDWFQFNNFLLPDVILYNVWTDGREVFAVGNTTGFPQVSIVLHGK